MRPMKLVSLGLQWKEIFSAVDFKCVFCDMFLFEFLPIAISHMCTQEGQWPTTKQFRYGRYILICMDV